MAILNRGVKRFRAQVDKLGQDIKRRKRNLVGTPTSVVKAEGSLEMDRQIYQRYFDIDNEIRNLNQQRQATDNVEAQRGLQLQADRLFEQQQTILEQSRIAKLERQIDALDQSRKSQAGNLSQNHVDGLNKQIQILRSELAGLEKMYQAQGIVFPVNETLRTRWDSHPVGHQVPEPDAQRHFVEQPVEAPQQGQAAQRTAQDYLDEQAELFEDISNLKDELRILKRQFDADIKHGVVGGIDGIQAFLDKQKELDDAIYDKEQALKATEQALVQLGITVPTEENLRDYLDEVAPPQDAPAAESEDYLTEVAPPQDAPATASEGSVSEDELDQFEQEQGWNEAPTEDDIIAQILADGEPSEAEPVDPFDKLLADLDEISPPSINPPQSGAPEESPTPVDAQPEQPDASPEDVQPAASSPQEVIFMTDSLDRLLAEFERVTEQGEKTDPDWEQKLDEAAPGKAMMQKIKTLLAEGDLARNPQNLNHFVNSMHEFDQVINALDASPYRGNMVNFRDQALELFVSGEITLADTIENRKMFGNEVNYIREDISRADVYQLMHDEFEKEINQLESVDPDVVTVMKNILSDFESGLIEYIEDLNHLEFPEREFDVLDINAAALNGLLREAKSPNPNFESAYTDAKVKLNEIMDFDESFQVHQTRAKHSAKLMNRSLEARVDNPLNSRMVDDATCEQLWQEAQKLIESCENVIDKSQKTGQVFGKKNMILNPKMDRALYRQDKTQIVQELRDATMAFQQLRSQQNLNEGQLQQYEQTLRSLEQKNQTLDSLASVKKSSHPAKDLIDRGKHNVKHGLDSLKEKVTSKVKHR